jgi:hypothetical protein
MSLLAMLQADRRRQASRPSRKITTLNSVLTHGMVTKLDHNDQSAFSSRRPLWPIADLRDLSDQSQSGLPLRC